jgi:hypothetical protein
MKFLKALVVLFVAPTVGVLVEAFINVLLNHLGIMPIPPQMVGATAFLVSFTGLLIGIFAWVLED